MPQRPASLQPFASIRHYFGAELRAWRQLRGLSLARLGQVVHNSGDLLGKIEKAQRWPSEDLVYRCDTALQACGALARLYALAQSQHIDRSVEFVAKDADCPMEDLAFQTQRIAGVVSLDAFRRRKLV
ncbi:helix-turn-helix transcriptional regulator [Dactylosporangium sp. NPDC051485]|uniref:helix-turn-helix domain-containing protein n=1 Tax=Dactylosporangium sp. NPDC051485 TaxID=3154846 RepID=UPI00341ADE98